MRKVKLTELYNVDEGNIVGNPEIDPSGSLTHGAGEYSPTSPNSTNPHGPQGPATVG